MPKKAAVKPSAPPFQSRVDAAALLLVREGRIPTIDAVRERMGGGSPNMVGPALRTWRAKFGRAVADGRDPAEDVVPPIVLEVASALWAAALVEAGRHHVDRASVEGPDVTLKTTHTLLELVRRLQALEARLKRQKVVPTSRHKTRRGPGTATRRVRPARSKTTRPVAKRKSRTGSTSPRQMAARPKRARAVARTKR